MRTNIVIDDDLVRQAMELTGARTQQEVVHVALTTLIERRRRKSLLDLAGQLDLAPGFDHKALRELRRPDSSPVVVPRDTRRRQGAALQPCRAVRR